MTKEDKIIEEWGFDFPKSGVTNDGWFLDEFNSQKFDNKKFEVSLNVVGVKVRPKSLQGIENNNGWTKIESIEDLPLEKVNCYYYDLKVNYLSDLSERENSRLKNLFELGVITHLFIVKPTPTPKPPIY